VGIVVETDPRLVAAAEAAGIELLPWQAEVGTRVLSDERFFFAPATRGGRTVLRRLIDEAQLRESSGDGDVDR
jgi:hypothetical protein